MPTVGSVPVDLVSRLLERTGALLSDFRALLLKNEEECGAEVKAARFDQAVER